MNVAKSWCFLERIAFLFIRQVFKLSEGMVFDTVRRKFFPLLLKVVNLERDLSFYLLLEEILRFYGIFIHRRNIILPNINCIFNLSLLSQLLRYVKPDGSLLIFSTANGNDFLLPEFPFVEIYKASQKGLIQITPLHIGKITLCNRLTTSLCTAILWLNWPQCNAS